MGNALDGSEDAVAEDIQVFDPNDEDAMEDDATIGEEAIHEDALDKGTTGIGPHNGTRREQPRSHSIGGAGADASL